MPPVRCHDGRRGRVIKNDMQDVKDGLWIAADDGGTGGAERRRKMAFTKKEGEQDRRVINDPLGQPHIRRIEKV